MNAFIHDEIRRKTNNWVILSPVNEFTGDIWSDNVLTVALILSVEELSFILQGFSHLDSYRTFA